MKFFDLSHFKENCPTEAKNYFNLILKRLKTIEKNQIKQKKKLNKKTVIILLFFIFIYLWAELAVGIFFQETWGRN